MAKSTQQVKNNLQAKLNSKANRGRYLSAVIGHPDGTVAVEDRPGYAWARLGGESGQIIQVYVRGILAAYNLPIVVYRLPHRPRDYGVVDLDIDAFASTGSGESNTGGYDGTGYVQKHGGQHWYIGGDPVLIHLRAWTPLRVYKTTGFVIGVMSGLIARSGADLEIVSQTLDLASHVPSDGALYTLITVDAAGILTATDGTLKAGNLALTLADIPDTPAGHFRLAAIRLYTSQTSIQENRTTTDIVDLRWPQERLASGITLDDLPTPIDIAHGGTNATTANAALNNLLPNQAGQAGNVLGTDGTNTSWGVGGGGSGTLVVANLPAGAIIEWTADSIPQGWLECNGSAVSRTTYADLFAVIGETYGAGDGSTTFNLPDIRGRVVVGRGTGSGLTARTLAATGGEESHTLTTAEIPAHVHGENDKDGNAISSGAYPGAGAVGMGTVSVDADTQATTSAMGGGSAHNTMQPFVVLVHIIKYTSAAPGDVIFDDGADPAYVTLTADTGSDAYAARRDHVHALDVTIAPTWTGAHTFSGNDVVLVSEDGKGFVNTLYETSATHAPAFAGLRANGSLASPTAVDAGVVLGRFSGRGHDGAGWPSSSTGRMDVVATETWDAAHHGTAIKFYTTPNADTNIALAATLGQDKSLAVVGPVSALNLSIASGKVLTVNNSLTLAGTDSSELTLTTSLTNQGGAGVLAWPVGGATLTVGGNSTINGSLVGNMTGGGTVATGGFNGTIPETMTFAGRNVSNTFTAAQSITVATATANGLAVKTSDDSTTNHLLRFTSSTDAVLGYIGGTGRIIFGSSPAPTSKFSVELDGNGGVFNRYAGAPLFGFWRANGTSASKTAVGSGDSLAVFGAYGYDGAAYQAAALLYMESDGTISSGVVPGRVLFRLTDSAGALQYRGVMKSSGRLGWGTTSPGAHVDSAGIADEIQLRVTGYTTQAVATPMVQFVRADASAGVSAMLGLTALGSGANGDGGSVLMNGKSSTSAAQSMAKISWLWNNATHASAVADMVLEAYYNNGGTFTASEFVRGRGGASPAIGFLTATPIARYSATGDLRQALIDFGLYTTGGASPLDLNGGRLTGFVSALASTTASASIKIPAGVAPTSPVDGDVWNDSTQAKHATFTNGLMGWIERCIWSGYAEVTHTGAVTAQSMFTATAKGTRTLPANFWKQGKALRVRLHGHYTTDAAAGNATIDVVFGGTTFRTTGSFGLDNSVTDGFWALEFAIVCETTGATGTINGTISWIHSQTTGGTTPVHAQPMTTHTPVTFDTTASATFDVLWTATDAGTVFHVDTARIWEVC